jgi:hypothetical protein
VIQEVCDFGKFDIHSLIGIEGISDPSVMGGRAKIKIRRIENPSACQVCFSKRPSRAHQKGK